MPKSQGKFMTEEDFFTDAKPTQIIKRAVKELKEQRENEAVDQDQARLNATWTVLAHQVVGQEKF